MVYICSPLRGDVEGNYRRAVRYCEYAAGCGVIPIAPHVAWHGIFDDTVPEKRETALKLGLGLLGRCDEIWVMGNEISQGMQGEIDEAKRLHIAVNYVLDEVVERDIKLRREQPPLREIDCVVGSYDNQDYTGKILVIDPENLKQRYRNSDNSLWIATYGTGCQPGKNDRTVHVANLFTGETAAFGRYEFYGVVKPESLLNWLQDHPVKHEQIGEYVQSAEWQPDTELTAEQNSDRDLLIHKIQDLLLPWENKLLNVLLDEACRQWCDFVDEIPERLDGEGFSYFFQQICEQKQCEYEPNILEDFFGDIEKDQGDMEL